MTIEEILSHVDHTNLKPEAGWNDIKTLCDDAIHYQTASICIPPGYCRQVRDYVSGRVQVCTVIGFPNGYSTTGSKIYEAVEACDSGASEIDMVININFVKSGRMDEVANEIKLIADAVHSKGAILKSYYAEQNGLKVITNSPEYSEKPKRRKEKDNSEVKGTE